MTIDLILQIWQSLPQIIAALFGTIGFALVFKIKGNYLIFVALGGFCTYVLFIITLFLGYSDFTAALISAVFVALLSEILARVLKAPTIIFLTTISISIVPGSGLYYSMRYLLLQDMVNFVQAFRTTCAVATGIVCGIVLISVNIKIFVALKRKFLSLYQKMNTN